MSSKPSWLDDDVSDDNEYGDSGSPDIRTGRDEPVAPMPTPPRAPPTKNESAFIRSPATQHIAPLTHTAPRNTDDDLEANGLGFLKSDGNNYLRKAPARKDDHVEDDLMSENSSFASSQLDKNPLKATKSTKNGLLLEDMTGAPPTTNAPVHFIKRMQEAERKRQERLIASPPTSGAPSSSRVSKVTKVKKVAKVVAPDVSTNPQQRTPSSSSSSSSSSSLSFSSEVPEEDRVEARLAKSQKRDEKTRLKAEKRQAKNEKKNPVLSAGGSGSASVSLGGTMNSNASMARTLNEAMGLEQIDSTLIEPEEAPADLDAKAKAEFSDVIECFGEEIAKFISSKKYSHRCTGIAKAERAVVAAQHRDDDRQHMEVDAADEPTEDAFNDILVNAMGVTGEFNTPPTTPPPTRTPDDEEDDEQNNATFINTKVNTHSLAAFFHVIDKSVSDTVIPVCKAGCTALVGVVDCIRDIPSETLGWGGKEGEGSAVTASPSTIAGVAASLVRRLKDSNNKVRESVTSALISIGKHKSISGTELVLSITKDSSEDAGHLIAKIDVAQTVLETTDIYKPDVSSALLNLAVSALSCSNIKTRKRGVSFFTYLNMVLGDTAETNNVDMYLTKVNPSTVKMLKQELNMAENDVFGPSKSLKGTETVSTASSTIQKTQARRDEIDDVAQLESEEAAGNISPEHLKKIAKYQEAFGMVVPSVGCVESSQWKLRERAIGRLVKVIKEGSTTMTDARLESIVDIASSSLADSVPAVTSACLTLLKETVKQLGGGSAGRGRVLVQLCGQLAKLTNLTTEAASNAAADEADSMKAIEADDAAHILLSLAKSTGSHNISKELVTQPLSGSHHLAVDKMFLKGPLKIVGVRLDILTMITNVTTTDRNVDLTMLMQTATTAFGHAQSKVRLSAAALITSLYRRFGEQIRPFLTGVSGAAAEELRKRMSSLTKRDKAKAGVGKKLAIFRGGIHDEDVDVPVMTSPRPPQAPSSQASPHTSLRNRIAAANKPPPPSPPQTGQKLSESSNGLGTPRLNAEPVLLAGNGPKPPLSSRKGNLVFS